MVVKKRKLPLQPDEDHLLRIVYSARKIPSDQYSRRPDDLRAFIADWNNLAVRSDSAADVLHYIKTLRKQKKWVTFDGNHMLQPLVKLPEMTPDEWVVFDAVYVQICTASDNYVYNPSHAKRFIELFAAQTGRKLTASDVIILMVDRRKEGFLPKLELPPQRPEDMGFHDLDDAANL